MSGDLEKDILTYEAAETVYLQEEEVNRESLRSGEARKVPQRQTGGERAERKFLSGRTEKEFQTGSLAEGFPGRIAEESMFRRRDTESRRRGALLTQEVSLGKFFVPAGMCSRGGGGQAQVYDCYVKGEPVPAGEPDYVAKLYYPPRNDREGKALEKTKEMNRVLAGLDHSNLPKLYAAGESDSGGYYMVVMKRYDPYDGFLELESFRGNIRLFERMFLEEAEGLNGALMLLHGQKIYHSDIKPANIMQYEDTYGRNHLVLIDFGIGVRGENADTKVGVAALGKTDFYLAPELYSVKKRKVNQYTDYYSFGITMAEFVAGRYPMVNNMRDREQDREYAERNRDSLNRFYGLLLPEELPDYLVRFFEGTLYGNTNISIEELYRRRWSSKEVSAWLSAVRERDYRRARSIPTGRQIEEEEAKRNGKGIYVKYDSEEQAIAVHSTEEMAMMFLTHWDETIEKLLRNTRWSRIFSRLGEDVSELVEQTRQSMQADRKNREQIFDRMLMETYLPERIKREALRYRGLLYSTKKEFGQNLYAMLLQEKKTTNGIYRLPGEMESEKKDLFCRMADLFASGTAERFFERCRSDWELGEVETKLARQIRESLKEQNKTKFVEALYRLSFRLQGEACLHMEGMETIYRRNRQFLKDFRLLYQERTDEAGTVLEQCFDEENHLRIDYYVFLQEAPDVVKRPDASMREWLI